MSGEIATDSSPTAKDTKSSGLTPETAFPLGLGGLETGVTPNVLERPDQPAEYNLNGYINLKALLCAGEGLYNKWHVVDRFETDPSPFKPYPDETYPNKTCPTRICASCGEKRVLQQYTRLQEPYGRIETNHAVCNYCKWQNQGIRLTREHFHRKYLGFEGVWLYSEGLWVPWFP